MKRQTVAEFLERMSRNWPKASNATSAFVPCIYRLQEYLQILLEDTIVPFGIQAAEFEVLLALRSEGKPFVLTPTEICQRLLISSGGLTKILGRLTRKELIERRRSAIDRRSHLVCLRPRGRKIIEGLMLDLLAKERKYLNAIEKTDIQSLEQALMSLLDQFECEERFSEASSRK